MTLLRCSSFLVGTLTALTCSTAAVADIYKCVDPNGHITYSNDKPLPGLKGCTLMSRDQAVTSVPAPPPRAAASKTPTPSSFPRVDDSTQKNRDNDRRKILETELANEETLLASAKKALAEQEAVRNGDEKNYQKFLDRIQPYKDKVALHERNVEAINKEIAKLK